MPPLRPRPPHEYGLSNKCGSAGCDGDVVADLAGRHAGRCQHATPGVGSRVLAIRGRHRVVGEPLASVGALPRGGVPPRPVGERVPPYHGLQPYWKAENSCPCAKSGSHFRVWFAWGRRGGRTLLPVVSGVRVGPRDRRLATTRRAAECPPSGGARRDAASFAARKHLSGRASEWAAGSSLAAQDSAPIRLPRRSGRYLPPGADHTVAVS